MSASSMVFKLHSASAYGKSNSTIANFKRSIPITGRGLLAAAFALLIVVNAGASQSGQQSPGQQLKDQQSSPPEIETNGADFVWLGDSEARELLDQLGLLDQREGAGREGEERLAAPCFDRFSEGRRPQADRSFGRRGA